MAGEREIQDIIRQLAGNDRTERVYAVDAEVISVDEGKRTARVRSVGGKSRNEFTARLMASVDDGILVIPEIESTVSVILGDFTTPYISQFSGVDKIVFRGGEYGGLVKVIELTEKLNKIEDLVNDIIEKYNTHTHAGVQAGGSSTAVPSATETTVLVKTTRDDIENKKITHN